jgi:HEAT repeat protein
MLRMKRVWVILSILLVIGAGVFLFAKPIKTYLHERHIMRMLNSDDASKRAEGLGVLVEAGSPTQAEFVSRANELLRDESTHVRRLASLYMVMAMAHDGIDADALVAVIPNLLTCLDDEDRITYIHAYMALGAAGPRAIDAMAPLRERFETEEDPGRRWRFAETMELVSPGSMWEEALAAMEDPAVMSHAANVLERVYVHRGASAGHMPELATAALDALAAEVAELGPGVDDWPMERWDNFISLESLLVNLLEARPDLLGLYESYRSRGIDPFIESIIAESGIIKQQGE